MKTYTLLLDILILSLLTFAVSFCFSHDYITNSFISRRGVTRTMIISWQSLLVISSFCIMLRYIARNVRA